MPFFGVPIRNGLPIGLGSVAGFGVQQFDPSQLFEGGTVAGAWYDPSDLTTLYTTSTGTTPVAMPGQGAAVPVGLMLDKRVPVAQTGYYSGVFDGTGDYLTASDATLSLGTGDFTLECWIYATSTPSDRGIFESRSGNMATPEDGFTLTAFSGNVIRIFSNGILISSSGTSYVENWCHVAVVRASGTWTLYINGTSAGTSVASRNLTNTDVGIGSGRYAGTSAFSAGFPGFISNFRLVKGVAIYTGNFIPPSIPLTAVSGTLLLTCQNSTFIDNSSNAFSITTNGDAKTGQFNPLGNHAIAFNNTTARPELRARVNLLTYSEEFDNGAWNFASQRTSIVTPGVPYYKLAEAAPAAGSVVHRVINGIPSINNVDYVFSVVAKADTRKRVLLYHFLRGAWFDLVTGQCGADTTYPTSVVPTMVAQNDGSYICTMKFTAAFTGTDGIQIYIGTDTQTTITATRIGDGTSGVLCKSADLRPANIGANVPAYQRIADANTYDTSGFPLYLRFDGIDDSMYTPANLNLSGTDKVSVFAGVRKNAEVAIGQVFTELSSSFAPNNGSFGLLDVGAPNYTPGFGSRGTATAYPYPASGYSAPLSMVLTGIGNIAAPLAQIRANGSVAASSTASQGTGNYGTYPLYIGARNNSSLWLNGHLHSLIIAGSAVSAGNISATEQWVAGKTGISIFNDGPSFGLDFTAQSYQVWEF